MLSLRSSTRPKTSVNYVDTSDDDSDYEPNPKRNRNTDVGLCEPSKSRLMAHARIVQAQLENTTRIDVSAAKLFYHLMQKGIKNAHTVKPTFTMKSPLKLTSNIPTATDKQPNLPPLWA